MSVNSATLYKMENKSPERISIQEISELLLDYANNLMSSGAYTARVVRNISRIAESFGYRVDMTLFQKTMTMTVVSNYNEEIRRTSVRRIKHGGVNFDTISQMSALSWRTYDNHISFAELKAEYHKIVSQPRFKDYIIIVAVTIGTSCFCRLFGGDLIAMGLVFVSTAVGATIRLQLMHRELNHMAIYCICSFVASMITSLGVWFDWGTTQQTALATSVLFLTPGVPMINSIVDLVDGHILVGISRAVNATILIICMALGLTATLLILGTSTL